MRGIWNEIGTILWIVVITFFMTAHIIAASSTALEQERLEENIHDVEKGMEEPFLKDIEIMQENKTSVTHLIEELSSNLTITILNETTASGEWRIHYPSDYAEYIMFAHELFKRNIEGVEKGMEDLFLQDVADIKVTEGDENLIVRFNLNANYTNGFVTGKYQSSYELAEFAPNFLSVLKIVLPQNKRLVSVNPGPNEPKANELLYYDYNWIHPLEIYYTEKDLADVTKASIGKEWELPKLPSSADILGEEMALGEIPTNEYSRFAEPYLWVGTDDNPNNHVPGTSKTAYQVANDYKPWLYNRTDQCPDEVYYRVINGYDVYSGFDAYLIQYFAYWNCQVCWPASHDYDYEPIFMWVRNIGERPYRVAYDHWDASNFHTHEIHRTYLWTSYPDGRYEVPEGTHTNEKAYYPFGNSSYNGDDWGAELTLHTFSTSLQDNWDEKHVKLGIANCWHTFDNDISGSNCDDYSLSPLTDNELITAYRLELDESGGNCCWGCEVEAFKYDVSDSFDWVFWEDHYHVDHEFSTLSATIDSAVVNNGVLMVNALVLYDNSEAGGSSGNDLRGLWKDRVNATVDGEPIGNPYSLNEYEAGRYTLEFDVSGISPDIYTLALNVTDNLDYNFSVDHETVIIQNLPPIASSTYTPLDPIVNQTITFNASDSYDPDGGDITKYEWVFDDGNIANTSEAIITHSYSEARDYMVNLTVEDDEGTRNTTSKTITVHPQAIFDTEAPAKPYPSIFGTHNGTITPNQTITVSTLYTYPCEGTGGHTEYARIWNLTLNVSANWDGYKEDWHNISFNKSFTLVKNKTYNYTIVTGSYPQIIHESPFNATGGTITCDKFIDANGWVYYDWIPAIKLFL